MDCELHWIGCQLEQISKSLSTPSPLDVISLIVSIAAVGATIWIAALNHGLIAKQNALEISRDTDRLRHLRMEYAGQLRHWIMSTGMDAIAGKPLDENKWAKDLVNIQFAGTLTKEPSNTRVRGYVYKAMDSKLLKTMTRVQVINEIVRVSKFVHDWAEDPASVDLSSIKEGMPVI
ncbi:hypothetical protein PQI23_13445 [Leucobacter sp. USCH14]|uniref:hypothetical protein n=1 Tax=Leucobacter sp. USCH14 TaxID=3024838 RepID=UPI0030A6C471